MNEFLANLLSAIAGGAFGLLFFGGLWWTLRRALSSPRPALWMGASALLRFAIVTAGFIVISAGHWQRLLMCLIGFWVARWLVQRLTADTARPASLPLRSSA
jgi:F1F0 ATPase subunit 2